MVYFSAKINSSIFSKKHWGLEPNADPHFNTGGLITIPVGMPNRNYASFK